MLSALSLFFLANLDGQPQGNFGPVEILVLLVVLLLELAMFASWIAGTWKMYTKAGQPGWAAIVPVYNYYIWMKIVNRPGWWVVMLFIPCVGIVFYIMALYDLAKVFGHDAGYLVGHLLLPFIFVPILGFGDSKYRPIIRPSDMAY